MKVGDRVRVIKGTNKWLNLLGKVIEDDGQEDLNWWVVFDSGEEVPFSDSELRVING